jgi:LmbE family N-acetylglucosaminyl deacetylase
MAPWPWIVVAGAPAQIDLTITVDRAAQLKAIACHASQSTHNPVLWCRLELLGDTEHLRYLRKPPA